MTDEWAPGDPVEVNQSVMVQTASLVKKLFSPSLTGGDKDKDHDIDTYTVPLSTPM